MTTNVGIDHDWEQIETICLQNNDDNDDDDKVLVENSESRDVVPYHGYKLTKMEDLETTEKDGSKNQEISINSRRPSTDLSTDTKSIQSDTRSYRERLRDRINVVKERAGMSALTTQKEVKPLKNSKFAVISRITDMLFKEEADVKAALEKHKKQKEMKKQQVGHDLEKANILSSRNANENEVISYEASVEFFTRVWKCTEEVGVIESELNSPIRMDVSPTGGQMVSTEHEDGPKLLAADYLGLKETLVDPAEFKTASTFNKEQIKRNQQQLFWFPTSNEEKLNPNRKIRDLREEGFYVPAYPTVRRKNVMKCCNRLAENDRDGRWFGDDGELIRLPNPMETTTYHLKQDEDSFGETTKLIKYEPAVMFGSKEVDWMEQMSMDECYVLELELIAINFSHHPLFNGEHVLANRLNRLYETYVHRSNLNVTKRLASKLTALRCAHDNLVALLKNEKNENAIAIHTERLKKYVKEIAETREQRMREGKTDNNLLIDLLLTWKELKCLRAEQGFVSTNVKLQILKSEETVTEDEWHQEVQRQMNEIVEESDSLLESNLDVVRSKVIEKISESMPSPGEPYVSVVLLQQPITPDNELANALEIHRRLLLKRSHIWFRILYNDGEVCKSSIQGLDSNFSCSLNQRFSIRIGEWPRNMSVQIYQGTGKSVFNDTLLAQVFVPIPTSGKAMSNSMVEKLEFSNEEEVRAEARHNGVGSGLPFRLLATDEKATCLYTTAFISYKTGWAEVDDKILSPPEYYFNNRRNSRRKFVENMSIQADTTKLKEWISSAHLDPNDPNNICLFDLLKKADSRENDPKTYFNLNSAQKVCEFCSDEEISRNPRLRLLMLRDRGEIEFKNIKAVPLRECEIPKDIFKSYEKRVSSPELPFETFGLGQLEIHRAWGHHSLNMLYDQILKQCKLSQQHRSTQDVIQEEKVPDIGTLSLTFMKLLQPKRPLRPRRKGRKRIPVKGLTGQEVKVIVNVVRAFEVPVRKDVDTLVENAISYVPVRPFVEVTFKGQTKRTVTADGPNPTWNQDLQFSLIGPNDGSFQVSNMHSFGDSLHIHLFDEIVVDILEDERIRDTTIHQRLERNWLGSLRIPFSTLYFNHQVEGTFQLYSPPFLLGYDRQSSLASSDQSHLRNSTFLTLFIIVQPPLSPPDPIMEHLECSESTHLEQHLESWRREVGREVPHRPVKTLVTDVGGKSVCVTRFFLPLEPPLIYEGEETTAEMIARYVSLIPVSTSGTLLFGHFNVWLTCDQTIRLLLGEREDHAVLLCCFLMKLGLKAWLLFGNGIPHGYSAYVLTRHDAPLSTPSYYIWDPVTGLKYSSMDSFSPLHKVYCLANDENLWVNIQSEDLVRRTKFEVSQRSDWWPAFGRNVCAPSASIQPLVIEYTHTSKTDVHLLQDKIEKHLRDSIMRWRPTTRTIWNRYCIATLRKLLPLMEREACGIKQQNSSDHLSELQHILGSHKICGFPISQPFTNVEAIIEAVKSTGVHINESPNVEFAVAVYVHPYPNDVLSVWVYAVSLTARRGLNQQREIKMIKNLEGMKLGTWDECKK